MVEVTKLNFDNRLNDVIDSIKRSEFVALDAEFTGLNAPDIDSHSLFDDGAERYRKLRLAAQRLTLTQIGLSAFVKHSERNCYVTYTYNFYIFPRAFGGIERHFLCQASSLDFLVKHKFDFNKFVYDGISHLNEEEESDLSRIIKSHDPFLGKKRELDEEALQSVCSLVAQWLVTATNGDRKELQDAGDVHVYILHSELRARFPQIWTEEVDGNLVIIKVAMETRDSLAKEESQEQEERLMKEMLGFTMVFRALVESKKLILGHNNLTDLVLMYQKFHKPLPANYQTFKADLHSMFPRILDTKHIVASLSKFFEDHGLVRSRDLSHLYTSLNSDRARNLVLFSPDIVHAEGFGLYSKTCHPHEAGYDAFMCGSVFLRMAHLWATRETDSMTVKPLSVSDYCQALSTQINRINIIRAAINHICVNRPDPVSRRPQWLVVKAKGKAHSLSSSELASLFSSYGTVDIKVKDSRQALVAVDTHRCGREILKAFYKHDTILVRKYSLWKHSTPLRNALWAGAACSSLVLLWSLYSSIKISSS